MIARVLVFVRPFIVPSLLPDDQVRGSRSLPCIRSGLCRLVLWSAPFDLDDLIGLSVQHSTGLSLAFDGFESNDGPSR